MGRIISIIGGGGKTTSMCAIAAHLNRQAVLMTTTTHIFPVSPPESRVLLPDPGAKQLLDALSRPGVVCAGVPEEKNGGERLCALSPELLNCAAARADWVVCEADGANRRPLKLHRSTEPVLPPDTDLCLVVIGLSALGSPVSETVHRYDRNPRWAADPGKPTAWDDIRFCIQENTAAAGLPGAQIRILLNQADALPSREQAERYAEDVRKLGFACMAGSMREDPLPILKWLLGT